MSKDAPFENPAQLLASIVDSSDDAIISKNLHGVITSWNEGAKRIFGYSSEEAVGQSILILIPPDRVQEEERILDRIRQGHRVTHFETVRQTKEGKRIHVSETISPMMDASGQVVGASKIARDISTQLELVECLRRSEERFRVTLSSIGDGVIATNGDGNIIFMNAVAEKLTGWALEEARLLPLPAVFKVINELTRQPLANPTVKVLQTGEIIGLDKYATLIARDGTERPIDDSGAPIRQSSGEIDGVVLTFRDITGRRSSEMAAQRLAAIVHGTSDAIVGKDLSGIITDWNGGAERMFGYAAEEIVGKSILTLIPTERRGEEQHILSQLIQGNQIEDYETIRLTKNGTLIHVSLTISPIRNERGTIIGASKIARDITARRQMAKALDDAQSELQLHARELERRVEERTDMLRKTVTELEAFSYSLSHDMRAPLRAIEGFLQVFMEDHAFQIGAAGLAPLERAKNAAKRMDLMIVELLAFSRLSHEELKIAAIDVEKLVQEIVQERIDLQPPRAIILVAFPLPTIMGHKVLLHQCLMNLLDNAAKFVAPGVQPRIRIYTEEAGDMARLWVEDNGIGISAEGQSQLFRMFQRLHGSDYPGTGVGLAIVHKAIERMGGTVGVESEPGRGSRFWLQLPRVQP